MANLNVVQNQGNRKPLGAQVNIPPRRMDFDFSKAPLNGYANDAYMTTFWAAFSALFPKGESFFVESVRHYRNQVQGEILKAQIAGFIGQEAMHSKEHISFNKFFADQGYPMDNLDRDVGLLLSFIQKNAPKRIQLAITVCLEHYTAIIAEYCLKADDMHRLADPEILNIWLWHAVEENEHKTVAFDVYELIGGNYLERSLMMIPTTLTLAFMFLWFHGRLLAHDQRLFSFKKNWAGINHFWGRGGMFQGIVPQLLDFFKPNFHPSQHDTNNLLELWRDKLFGEQGILSEQINSAQNKKLKN